MSARRLALFAVLATIGPSAAQASALEEYRVLSPQGDAPHPAVLLVPGCSGFVATNGINIYEERAEELQAAGYVVVFVDYLAARNVTECRFVPRTEVGQEILAAAGWVRGRPETDPGRIAVIGWSYGGGGVLAALAAMPSGPPLLAKAVLYYPDCRSAKPWSAAGVTALMLLGASDDVARPILCDDVATRAPAGSLRTILYRNAYHSFDVRSLAERVQYPYGTIGYNPDAAKASWASVLDFLK